MIRHAAPLLLSLTALALPAAAVAQSSDPAWLEDVQMQLADEKQCEVAFFVRVSEDKLGGRKTYLARAQCVDGRQFDATKTEGDDAFVIRTCQVEVC